MTLIPPKNPNDEQDTATLRTSVGALAELELAALMVTEERGEFFSRNEVVNRCINNGLEEFWRERQMKRPRDPLRALAEYTAKHKVPKRKVAKKRA